MPSVRLIHPLRFGRARNLDVHNVGRREGSAGWLAGPPAHAAPGRSGALWWSRTWRASRVRPPPHRGPLLGVRNTPKPLGRRAPRSPRKGRQHPRPHGWLRCALRSSSLARSARSRGGSKADHCLIPCSSVAHGPPCAVALTTEMIAVQASCPSLPTALPYAQSSLPQAKAPSTVTWRVILFRSESYCQGSGPFVLRGRGRSRKLAVALLGVHTPSKNLAPVSWIQGHIACARLKCGFDGGGIGSKLLRGWLAR